jgi:hypothetical protein
VKEDRCNNTGHPALQVRFSESFTYVVIATRVRVGATRYYVFFWYFGVLELSPLYCGVSVSVTLFVDIEAGR